MFSHTVINQKALEPTSFWHLESTNDEKRKRRNESSVEW